ncbi:MAG: hypothetical protein V7739_19595 [Motiliproteus sp.]
MKDRTSTPSVPTLGASSEALSSNKRFFCFTKLLLKTLKPKVAWHVAFHGEAEQWSMIQFRDGSDQFYHSKHLITCSKCQINKTAKRIWPKFNADLNNGYQLTEARQKASACSSQHCGSC